MRAKLFARIEDGSWIEVKNKNILKSDAVQMWQLFCEEVNVHKLTLRNYIYETDLGFSTYKFKTLEADK